MPPSGGVRGVLLCYSMNFQWGLTKRPAELYPIAGWVGWDTQSHLGNCVGRYFPSVRLQPLGPLSRREGVPAHDAGGEFYCSVLRTRRLALRARISKLFLFLQLLGQVVLIAHFVDGVQLRFEPVDVVLFV